MIPLQPKRNKEPLVDLDQGDAPAYMRLFRMSPAVFAFVFGIFCLCSFMLANWFGLLLINAEGVVAQIGILSALRITAALMGTISLTSIALMFHYRCLYTYEDGANVFFAITFSLTFLMGSPCALVGIFGG